MSVALEHTDAQESVLGFTITGEAIAYLVIGIAAVLLRFARLGAMPLSDVESYHALSALRFVDPATPGLALPPASPVLFAGQALSFALLGASDSTARLLVALAGAALALTPALWRARMGRLPALGFSALLALSPTGIAAARTGSGATISAGLAMLVVWLVWRFREADAGDRKPWAAALGVGLATMVLLVEPGGPLMALSLVGGLVFLWWTDGADGEMRSALLETMGVFPWKTALIAGAVSVALISTFVFIYPAGLSAAGQVLGDFVRGLAARAAAAAPSLPILVLLVYEPLVWIFGAIGLVSAVNSPKPLPRFLAGWAFSGLVLSLLYPGATSAHALWTVLPLGALAASFLIPRLLAGEKDAGRSAGWDGMWQTPGWGMAAYFTGLIGLSAAIYINLMLAGRDLANPNIALDAQVQAPRLVMVGLSIGMIVILFFLIGATWGSRTAVRGLLIGVTFVLGAYTLSGAAGLAFYRADDARELWYLSRPAREIHLLAEVVRDGSDRYSGAPNTAPIAAQIPPDGALAWALRDFDHLEFIDRPSADIATPVVVLPALEDEPALGADYVGQAFITRRTWQLDSMGARGLLAWLLQRHTYIPPAPVERYVVWMRTDVYGLVEENPLP